MRRIGQVAGAVLAVVGLLLTWSAFVAIAPARAGDVFAVGDDPVGAAQLLASANAERAALGLPALAPRPDVYQYAVEHSRRMADAYDIFHNDGYFTADVRRALSAKSLGENVAMNKSVSDAHTRLMNSPGHRANLLDPRFTVVGIAVVRTPDGMAFITQDFVQPNGTVVALAPVAPQDPAPAPSGDGGGPSAPAVAAPKQAPAPAPTTTPAPPTTTVTPPTTAAPPPTTAAPAPAPASAELPSASLDEMTPIAARSAPAELAAGRLTRTAGPAGHGRDPGTTFAAAVAIGALLAVALAALRAARASEDAVTHP